MDQSAAYLSNQGRYTSFTYGDKVIRFMTSKSLERYLSVKEWNNGYLVVDAKYSYSDEPVEDYIDLIPILKNLLIDPATFLEPIKEVRLDYAI